MAILTERKVWRREPNPNTLREKHKLTPAEQAGVRRAMAALRIRYGNWRAVARALKANRTTITRIICLRKGIGAGFAVRVARALGVPVARVLDGGVPKNGHCPFCGKRGGAAETESWERRLLSAGEPVFKKTTKRSSSP